MSVQSILRSCGSWDRNEDKISSAFSSPFSRDESFPRRMQIPHATARNVGQIRRIHERLAAKAGEHEAHEFCASRLDRETRRQRGGSIQIINAAGLAVSLK